MSKSSEQNRVDAEKERVIAEAKRAHAEKNTGTGRIEQEEGRVEAEQERMVAEALREYNHAEYNKEMELLKSDPAHYMTPATRSYFRRVWTGYVILAVAFTVGVWGLTGRQDTRIRQDLNTYATVSCKTTSRATIKIFNDFVQTNIEIQRDARQNNLRLGEAKRAALNLRAIRRFQNSKLPVRTDEECDRPILRP